MSAPRTRAEGTPRDRWLRILPASTPPPDLRLICLPPAGAGIGTYHGWPAFTPAWFELDLVKLPGRDARLEEPLPADLHRLAKQIGKQVRALVEEDDVPYVLFGHSLGGIVAYEVAALLERTAARPPDLLIVAGIGAPDDVVEQVRAGREQDPVDIVRELGGAVEEILERPELLELFAPAIVSDMGMLYAYEPSHHVLGCPLATVHSRDDPRTNLLDVTAWARWSRGPFEERVLSGGHHFPSEQPEVVVAAVVELTARYAVR